MNTDVLRGLVAAEILHPGNLDFRIHALPPKRFARMEVLHAFDREHSEATPTRPYAHSSPPERLQGPGENAEWVAFSATSFVTGREDVIESRWLELAAEGRGRQRAGTAIALGNMRRGLRPPQSGHDNPHYFDDLAMARAVGAVALHDVTTARALVAADAHATHDLDGAWAADAVVVLLHALLSGAPGTDAARLAAEVLPEHSWSRRLAEVALSAAAQTASPFELSVVLSREVCDWIYSYPVAAPETLAVLLAHVSAATSAEALLAGTSATGRNGTTLAALSGAASAALFGADWIPSEISLDVPLAGLGVPRLAGVSLADAVGYGDR
ncbi:ADP-ribosylglycohydrolase family protein [Microbacterium sp. KR10-403]|uniref:ADP-ribosylglycohydrolase family protein n=1 Tax=Microbacterium sp. KR10-403 TaxID=3158581 RepID=UPI0032E435AE